MGDRDPEKHLWEPRPLQLICKILGASVEAYAITQKKIKIELQN